MRAVVARFGPKKFDVVYLMSHSLSDVVVVCVVVDIR